MIKLVNERPLGHSKPFYVAVDMSQFFLSYFNDNRNLGKSIQCQRKSKIGSDRPGRMMEEGQRMGDTKT